MLGKSEYKNISADTGSTTVIQRIANADAALVRGCPDFVKEVFNECRVKCGLKPVEFSEEKLKQ
jgi:hypothetical protein